MSRALSTTAKAGIYAQQTDQVYIVLLTIDQEDLDEPIRLANNYANVTSNGETYVGFPFTITLPNDSDENVPHAQLTIDNVDRAIVNAVRTMTTGAVVTVSVVLASSPNTVEVGPFVMTLRNVSWNATTVSGTLQSEDLINEPFPGEFMTPNTFPGLF